MFLERNELHLTKKRKSEKRDLSPNSSRRVDNIKQIMSLPHSEPFQESPFKLTGSDNDNSPLPTQKKYTNANLIKDWNARDSAQFPDHWGMNSTDNGILFAYVGDMEYLVTRSIFVKEDMSVEVS